MVRHLPGLVRLPNVASVSRTLASLDDARVTHLRRLSRQGCRISPVVRACPHHPGKAVNQVYLLSVVLVHNLNREMQMLCYEQERNTTEKRTPL